MSHWLVLVLLAVQLEQELQRAQVSRVRLVQPLERLAQAQVVRQQEPPEQAVHWSARAQVQAVRLVPLAS